MYNFNLTLKKILIIFIVAILTYSCNQNQEVSSINPVNWKMRTVNNSLSDSLTQGITYLSVYSQIYDQSEHRTFDLTVTVSMRNTNKHDTIYIDKAEYFDTKGKSIRKYFNETIYIAPMETIEIVINEMDQEGGTGANFLFDWRSHSKLNEPLFEGVMISTSGQQGLSFTTTGKRIN